MKKKTYILMAMAVLVVLFASACGGSAPAPVDQAPPAANNPPAQPVQQGQSFAPACQSGGSCGTPAITDLDPINTYCVKKIPYQNISLDPGTTFESLDTSGELKCYDSGTVVDGKNVITCTGKELWTYQLKLTNTACGGAALATGTGQCAEDQGYDAANNCCAPISAGGGGSTIINVNIGACPIK